MNAKTLIPLVIAIALGVVAAKMGKDMMGKGRGNDGPTMKFSKQVVAKEDLAPGATIKDTDVTLKDMPADNRAEQSFSTVADVVGRVVTTQIVKNQAVMNTLLAPSGAAGGMGAMIPPGMRAVTLEVNEVSGLAGLLIPGAKVDLVQTIQVKGTDQGMMAKTIVENVQVLAVGRRTSTVANTGAEADPLAHSVTLLATAEQAEAIDLASHVGSPRLVLRNSADKKNVNSKGITIAELRGDDAAASEDAYDRMLADSFGGSNPPVPATKPVDPVKPDAVAVETPKVKNYRDVEVIRAGASTNVRIGLNVDGAGTFTGGRDGDKKLFGDD